MPLRPTRSLSIRAILLLTMAALALYVVAVGSYIVFDLAPATAKLRTRSAHMVTQYEAMRARSSVLRDAFAEAQRLSRGRTLPAADRARVLRMRADVAAVANEATGVQVNREVVGASSETRVALALAAGVESDVAGALVEALDDLTHGDVVAARQALRRSEADRLALAGHLEDAQRLGLHDLTVGERELSAHTSRVVRAIGLGVVVGAALLTLALVAVHRRVYQPLAALDAAMARVAGGDLQSTLPVERHDEFGMLAATFNQMTDVLRSRPEVVALRENEAKFRALFETADDAILLFAEGKWVDCNSGALRVFGCSRDEIIGAHPSRFSPPTQPDGRASEEAAFRLIQRAYEEGPQSFEWQHCRADGSTFAAEVHLNRVDLAATPHIQAIVRDVTVRKQAERVIAEQLDELRRWHDALLGREMRVMELKQEINDLCLRHGEPTRYRSQDAAAAAEVEVSV